MIKVPFLSFCVPWSVSISLFVCESCHEKLTPRFGTRTNRRVEGDPGLFTAEGELILVDSLSCYATVLLFCCEECCEKGARAV